MGKKKRILFTIPNFKTAGSQYVLMSIFRSIDTSKYDLYICVERFPEYFPKDIPMNRRLLLKKERRLISDTFAFLKLLRKHKIDLVHSWDYKSNFEEAIACKLAGVKYLYTKKNNSWSKRWHLKSFLAKHIAYDNPTMKVRFFKAFYFKNKISFIPHGVDLNSFMPLPKIQHKEFNLCCVGNINSNKNQIAILEALCDLPEKVQAHFYGNEEKTYRQELNLFIKKHNLNKRVHFHGYVHNHELPNIYREHDLFILASKNEGFPVCLLEAIACGVPVLSSNSGGGAAYMLEGNKGGCLFDLNTSKDLVDKILYLMQNAEVYDECKKTGIHNVKTRFSLTNEIKAYDALYLKMIN